MVRTGYVLDQEGWKSDASHMVQPHVPGGGGVDKLMNVVGAHAGGGCVLYSADVGRPSAVSTPTPRYIITSWLKLRSH